MRQILGGWSGGSGGAGKETPDSSGVCLKKGMDKS